jgi:hypothetical protein
MSLQIAASTYATFTPKSTPGEFTLRVIPVAKLRGLQDLVAHHSTVDIVSAKVTLSRPDSGGYTVLLGIVPKDTPTDLSFETVATLRGISVAIAAKGRTDSDALVVTPRWPAAVGRSLTATLPPLFEPAVLVGIRADSALSGAIRIFGEFEVEVAGVGFPVVASSATDVALT